MTSRPEVCKTCSTFEKGREGSNQQDCERRDSETKETPAEKADRLADLDIVLAYSMYHFTRSTAKAYITDGASTSLPQALRELDDMREAIRRFDAGEPQVFQEKAKEE